MTLTNENWLSSTACCILESHITQEILWLLKIVLSQNVHVCIL